MSALPNTIGLIGTGLIGGSLVLALRAYGYRGGLYAYDRDPAAAEQVDGIDDVLSSPEEVLARCELVVIAVPAGSCQSVFQAMKPAWSMDKVVSDISSVKQATLAAARTVFGDVPDNFVPAHPIAGNEKSGPAAAQAQLFAQRCVLLTPIANTKEAAVAKVCRLWESVGAYTERIASDEHDCLLARSSHLPHVLAYALMHSLLKDADRSRHLRYAAGGLHDFARIAASNPIMWRDVCLLNSEQLLTALDHFRDSLGVMRAAIERQDGKALEDLFSAARKHKLSLPLPPSTTR